MPGPPTPGCQRARARGWAGPAGRAPAFRDGVACALFAVATLAGAHASAQNAAEVGEGARPCVAGDERAPVRIFATATGARRVAGNITYTLYGDRPASFLAPRGSIALERVTLAGTSATACFVVTRPGTYALAIYHDENNHHHFERSALGLPLDGYGFSNNPTIFLGPPSFGAAGFAVRPGDNHVTIRLRY